MARFQAREIGIGYDDVGTGPPIVLVHGHPFNRTMWQPQVRIFQSRYRPIAPDLRGYGESDVVPGKTPLETFARDIADLLDHLQLDNIVLGGLSMGGQIAMEFVRLFPQQVRALLLADTFAQAEDEAGREQRYAMAERLTREGMDAYARDVLPRMIAPRTIAEQPATAAHVLAMMLDTAPAGAAAALRGRAERPDYVPLLGNITVPTLIVVGSDDEFTPVSDAEFLHKNIAGSELAIIPNAGHMPNLEYPDDFNRAFDTFLHRLA